MTGFEGARVPEVHPTDEPYHSPCGVVKFLAQALQVGDFQQIRMLFFREDPLEAYDRVPLFAGEVGAPF
jgi:hypothetical protein